MIIVLSLSVLVLLMMASTQVYAITQFYLWFYLLMEYNGTDSIPRHDPLKVAEDDSGDANIRGGCPDRYHGVEDDEQASAIQIAMDVLRIRL